MWWDREEPHGRENGAKHGSAPGNLLEKSRVRNTVSLCISKALKCGSWSLDPTRLSWCLTGEHTPSLLWQPVPPGNISSYIALQKESNISSLQEAHTLIRKNQKLSSLTLILHIRKSKMGKSSTQIPLEVTLEYQSYCES